MFFFKFNESRIYKSFKFWNSYIFFYDTLILWDVPVYIYISGVKISALMQAIGFFFSV